MRARGKSFKEATGLAVVSLDAPASADAGPHVLAVPGVLAPIYHVALPDRVPAASRLRIAAQQLAERLGIPVDSLRIVPLMTGRATATTWDRAMVVDPAQLAGWASRAGPSCRAILPDYLTLPAAPDAVTLVRRGETVLARIGEADGFSAPALLAATLLKAALIEAKPERATVGASVPESCRAVLDEAGVPYAADHSDHARVSSAALKHDLRAALASASSRSDASARVWAAVAAMALLAVGLWAASLWVEIRGIEQQTQRLRAGTTEILRQGLLPTDPIVDIRTQVTRRLAESAPATASSSGPTVTQLIARVSALLADSGHRIETLILTEDALALDLIAPDFAAVDALEASLLTDGLAVRGDEARSLTDRGVEARIRIDRKTGDAR